MPPAPTPFHVLRHHQSPIHHLAFSQTNQFVYSGDEEGNIAVIDLKLKRVVAGWKAHEAGVLGVGEWEGGMVSQGRDNVIHFHAPLSSQPEASTSSSSKPDSTSNPEPPAQSPDLSSPTDDNDDKHDDESNPPDPTPPLPFNPTLIPHRLPTTTPLLPAPRKIDSLPTNSLNFCKFALVEVPPGAKRGRGEVRRGKRRVLDGLDGLDGGGRGGGGEGKEGLLGVPNLMDSDSVDIYHLPSLTRLHAAFTKIPSSSTINDSTSTSSPAQTSNKLNSMGEAEDGRSALIMGIHLSFVPMDDGSSSDERAREVEVGTSANNKPEQDNEAGRQNQDEPGQPKKDDDQTLLKLRAILAFEDGRVEAWECRDWTVASDMRLGRKAGGWECRWREKGHNEAIMAMTVSPKLDYAFTVSADHQLVRYTLRDLKQGELRMSKHSTKQIGNADVKVDPSGKIVAVAGWDGSVRLYSVKTFKSLGTLKYHRETINTIVFPHLREEGATAQRDLQDDDEDEGVDRRAGKSGLKGVDRWLATGGKDRRVALWELADFARKR